ncbi:MAG: hypothetical protein ACREQ5_19315 [Candidatus Dormibacteria bacterium]
MTPMMMKKHITLIAASLVASVTVAMTGNVSTPNPNTFDTEDAAAIAAEQVIVNDHKNTTTEEAGGVYQTPLDGKFHYTNPVGNGAEGDFSVRIQFQGKLVAIYHDHPAYMSGFSEYCSRYLSVPDVQIATQLHLDSYVGVLAEKQIVKWTPGKSRTEYGNECAPHERIGVGSVVGKL